MSFALKDIKGAVVEKKITTEAWTFNNGIDAQSSVKLRFNRDKLAKVICNFMNDWDKKAKEYEDLICNPYTEYGPGPMSLADAIIAADKDIVEVET